MKLSFNRCALIASSAALLLISGCGGSGDSTTNTAATDAPATSTPAANPPAADVPAVTPVANTATTLSGTAAIGQPIAGSVFAIDINGKVSPAATTSGLGAFILDVGGMTAPYILSITGSAGGKQVTLNSIATAAGQTVNITPLTDLIVSTAAGRPAGSSLVSLCAPVAGVVAPDCLSALTAAATPANLDAAVTAISAMIAPLNSAGTNPLTGAFAANGTGLDAVLDQILVSPADAQSAMATITLIATNTPLGQVTLPAAAGATATTTATAPSATDLTKAIAAATVLPEIRACLASFTALYPKTGFVAPSKTTVTTFLDSTFAMGRLQDQSFFATVFSDTSMEAIPGVTVDAAGLSPFDMSPLTATETGVLFASTTTPALSVVDIVKARTSTAVAFDSNGAPSSAWIKLRVNADAGLISWNMVKGAAYPGCASGWKMAGSKHLDMHMHARVHRNLDGLGGATFTREWAFHIDKNAVSDEVAAGPAVDTVVVRGPGLSIYSGSPSAPVGASQRLVLTLPVGANSLEAAFLIAGGTTFYGNAEALQSCQDLASTSAGAGTPCIDETQVAPGKLYSWVLKSGGANGTIVRAFPFQINSVPLSKAFAQANQADLFATMTSVTPAGIGALNTAIAGFAAGAALDGLFTFNYTQSATYGSRMDNCNIGLFAAGGTAVLKAEQNAVGSETSCTFNTSSLNSGALTKPVGTIQNGYVSTSTIVLGNNADSSQPF